MNTAKFYIKKRVDEEFYFILNSENNKTIMVSEGYTTRQNCRKGIDLKPNSVEDEQFKRKRSSSSDQYFLF